MAKPRKPRTSRRQAELLAHAEAAANAADAAIKRLWREVLKVLKTQRDPQEARKASRAIFAQMKREIRLAVGKSLDTAAHASYMASVNHLSRLSKEYLGHAVKRKLTKLPPGFSFTVPKKPESKEDFLKILFPSPTKERIFQVLNAGPEPWHAQLARATRLAQPDVLGQVIGNGYAAGKTQRQIAKDLMPVVKNVRVSARRIARTEGIRIGHAMQEEADNQLGDLVIGYTIHSVHGNPNSRPWHVQRDGTEYYKNPQEGQKGYYQMPRPPEEADDPRERPLKAPKTAYNCLCHRTPILSPLPQEPK
jgi:hypothetical protein